MDESVSKLNAHLKEIIEYINKKKQAIKLISYEVTCDQRITKIRERFDQYSEEMTHKVFLGPFYKCYGRLKFYSDNKLYVYLEVEERISSAQRSADIWPVMITWKLEIVDKDKEISAPLGSASCTFNRPRQGIVAHPNDWICIDLDAIVHSGLIVDRAATLNWTFVATPIFQIENVEEFHKILKKLEIFCDEYEGPEVLLIHIQKSVEEILQRNVENNSSIENRLSDICSKLEKIEKIQLDLQQSMINLNMRHFRL